MAAPTGNRNAARAKEWREALKMELASRDRGDLGKGLRRIAKKVVDLALEGDTEAWKEIGNRIDGKPTEHVIVDEEVTVLLDDSASFEARLDRVLAARGITRDSVQ